MSMNGTYEEVVGGWLKAGHQAPTTNHQPPLHMSHSAGGVMTLQKSLFAAALCLFAAARATAQTNTIAPNGAGPVAAKIAPDAYSPYPDTAFPRPNHNYHLA